MRRPSLSRARRLSVITLTAAALALPGGLVGRSARAAECPWMDAGKSPDERANMLLRTMTIDEKITMVHQEYTYFFPYGSAGYVPGNPDKCIPDLVLNDAGSGVGNAQLNTTAFPTGNAQASTWNTALQRQFGEAWGEEGWRKGVNVWLGPGVNIGRVPMNGRNFEYFGEDPYLAGQTAAAEISGIQSKHVVSTIKHYALNNQETDRMNVSAEVDERTVREIYLPAFETAVKQGGVGSAMCSYNKYGGVYACENPKLLNGYLKRDFGFTGWVMSDWSATHSTVASAMAGLDMDMNLIPSQYYDDTLKAAVENGEVPMWRLDDMVRRILRTMFRVGLFDHPITPGPAAMAANVSTVDHRDLARRISEESTVLLKNSGGILPLEGTGKTIAVIGPAAGRAARDVCGGGGSSAVQSCNTTVPPLVAIQQRASAQSDTVLYADGGSTADAVAAATAADVAIVFGYYTATEGGDRATLALDNDGDALIASVAAANPNTVVVLNTGGPVLMPWIGDVKAVLENWYPGLEGGTAIAAILFGDANPSGKLTQTFPTSEAQLPTAGDPAKFPGVNGKANYSEGLLVGYRHYDAKNITPLFPFGFGLSYTTFRYSKASVSPTADGAQVRFTLTNTGSRSGAEVTQVYVGFPKQAGEPPKQLKGYRKVTLEPGKATTVTIPLDARAFSVWDTKAKEWRIVPGTYTVMVGGSSRELPLKATLHHSGTRVLGRRAQAKPATSGAPLPATGVGGGVTLAGLVFIVAALFGVRIVGTSASRLKTNSLNRETGASWSPSTVRRR